MMSILRRLLAGCLALSLPVLSHAVAVVDVYGTLASTTTYDCAPGDQACDPIAAFLAGSSPTVVGSDGGAGMATATTSTGTWPTPGSASGSVNLVGGLAVPVLKAGAAAQPLKWIGGQAMAIQGYTYTGVGETLTLTWNLTGSVVNPDSDKSTGLAMFAAFVDPADLTLFPDLSNPLAVAWQMLQLANDLPTDDVQQFTATGAVVASGGIELDVTNGQQFYLVMGLLAAAGGDGAMAESLSTLTAGFEGGPQLTPSLRGTPVALPASLPLVLVGLLSIPAVRRRGLARAA